MKKITALLTLSILFLIGCTQTTKQQEILIDDKVEIETFWVWFENHADELYEFENNQDQLFEELSTELKKVDDNLTFEFGMVQENYTREFIISADGITSSFPVVKRLHAAAPKLKDWVITAFRPRIGTEFSINYSGIEVNGQRMKFSYLSFENEIDLKLFIPNYDSDDERYIGAAFIMLDNALGEYDVETKLGEIEFLHVPSDTTDLLPFSELPGVVDGLIN